jgi:hypothetical protein
MRSIITTAEFDQQVEQLGGARAIDEVLGPLMEALVGDPYGFEKFETDGYSFRWLTTKETVWTPALYVIFIIDPVDHYNVVLTHIEELKL